jgi:acetyl-CoA synthetase
MTWPTIHKTAGPAGVVPNVVDYDELRAAFSWDTARHHLDGLRGGRGLNIGHEAVDRHAAGPARERVVMRWLRRDGTVTEATYAELRTSTNRLHERTGIDVPERDYPSLSTVAGFSPTWRRRPPRDEGLW